MNAEIICVGTELLLGDILNTNAQYLSRELAGMGINLFYESVVGDNVKRLSDSITLAASRSDIIILTGGLGPTPDDLTKETVANMLGLQLVKDEASVKSIEQYFKKSGREMAENNLKQAMMPEGCHILINDIGTAPGCAIESGGKTYIIMPGVPREMTHMFENYVKPYLSDKRGGCIVSKNVEITGIGESSAAAMIPEIMESSDPTVSPYCKLGRVTFRVTSSAENAEKASEKCDVMVNKLKEIFGDNVFGIDVKDLQTAVVELLKERKLKVATAESCTGGMLSASITDVPGSSDVFNFGMVTYANEMKVRFLGVSESTIAKYGVVSSEAAAEMARGILKTANKAGYGAADIGIGITGIAGPGTSEYKPVGLVYISLTDGKKMWVQEIRIGNAGNDRDKVRSMSVIYALDMIRRYLIDSPAFMETGCSDFAEPTVSFPSQIALNSLNRKTEANYEQRK